MADDLISCDALRLTRGAFTLDVPAWRVPPGTVVGLVGPNGAGKTTLLDLAHGMLAPTSGTIQVLGHDPARDPVAVRSAVGFMSDTLPLWDQRVDRLICAVSGYYPTWDAALVDELVGRFKLDLTARAGNLSKGQGTRLRLVLAMAFRPRVLLLDEPATGLDLEGRHRLLQTVMDVVRDPSRSVIVSSHDLHDVERIADALLVLRDGAVICEGPTDELVGEERTLEEAMLQWGAA